MKCEQCMEVCIEYILWVQINILSFSFRMRIINTKDTYFIYTLVEMFKRFKSYVLNKQLYKSISLNTYTVHIIYILYNSYLQQW